MASTNPWNPVQCDFNYTRQDSTPIIFVKKDSAGDPIDNTGNTYKMEAHSQPDPTSETGQIFDLVGTAGGADGRITFSPVAGDSGTFGGTVPDVIFYDVVETAAGKQRTLVRGKITLVPRITDKGV